MNPTCGGNLSSAGSGEGEVVVAATPRGNPNSAQPQRLSASGPRSRAHLGIVGGFRVRPRGPSQIHAVACREAVHAKTPSRWANGPRSLSPARRAGWKIQTRRRSEGPRSWGRSRPCRTHRPSLPIPSPSGWAKASRPFGPSPYRSSRSRPGAWRTHHVQMPPIPAICRNALATVRPPAIVVCHHFFGFVRRGPRILAGPACHW